MRLARTLASIALVAAVMLSSAPAHAGRLAGFRLIDLTERTGSSQGAARAINEAGQIAGWSEDAFWVPVVWDTFGGEWTAHALPFYAPGCFWVEDVAAINDAGWVVGHARCNTGELCALLWPDPDTMEVAGCPGVARDVNNLGQIVANGWIWEQGQRTTVDTDGEAGAINDLSHVVGYHLVTGNAVLWIPSGKGSNVTWDLMDLGSLGLSAAAHDINESGQIVGASTRDDGRTRAFLWQDGKMMDLGVIAGFDDSGAYAVNNAGQIVGVAIRGDEPPFEFRGLLWQDGVMYDVNDLIIDARGVAIGSARAINDAGQIVGWGWTGAAYRAVLLDPITPGDVDTDGDVDDLDLTLLVAVWGPCAECAGPLDCPADLDGDCTVGMTDLLILLTGWQ